MKVLAGQTSLELIEESDRVCWHMRHSGDWEPQTLAAWDAACAAADGGTAVDVGAYSGIYAITAALRGCRVLAFEPVPRNADRVEANARANGVSVQLYRIVLSDVTGTAELRFNEGLRDMTSGGSILPTPEQVAKKGYVWATVPSRTLDSFRRKDVAVVKIDVERAEALVLKGATKTLARCKPTLFVEVLDEAQGAQVLEALPGYRLDRVLDGRNWMLLPT